MTRIRSSPLKSPRNLPFSSPFSLPVKSSHQIFTPPKVEPPFSLRSTRLTGYLVIWFPEALFPLIANLAKSYSKLLSLAFADALKCMVTFSASPLALDVKYNTVDLACSFAMLYIFSRIKPVALKRFAMAFLALPSQ